MLNGKNRACLRSGMERRDHEVSLYGPQKKQQKRNINEKENKKVTKTTNLWE